MQTSPKRKAKLKVRIKDLPAYARPREKLMASGQTNLTDVELVAILLNTGSAKQNAMMLSESLLNQIPLTKLPRVGLDDLTKFPGLGKSKASRILAAIELGERIFAPASVTQTVIRSTSDTIAQLRDIAGKKQEYLVVLYLNARYELLQKEIVGIGSLNNMRITPKEIFSPALQTPCAAIIVAHNHPSGDPTPSDDDIHFTTKIHEAGDLMGIPLLDHLIICKSGYFSFRDAKVAGE